MLDVKALIEILKKAVDELLTPIGNLNLKDIIIANQSLTDDNSGLLSPVALKLNGLEMGTLNISVDHNEDSIIPVLRLRQSSNKIKAYSGP
jgi:hypothetical protein